MPGFCESGEDPTIASIRLSRVSWTLYKDASTPLPVISPTAFIPKLLGSLHGAVEPVFSLDNIAWYPIAYLILPIARRSIRSSSVCARTICTRDAPTNEVMINRSAIVARTKIQVSRRGNVWLSKSNKYKRALSTSISFQSSTSLELNTKWSDLMSA